MTSTLLARFAPANEISSSDSDYWTQTYTIQTAETSKLAGRRRGSDAVVDGLWTLCEDWAAKGGP